VEIDESIEKGSLMNELIVYETPRASVRGVFLCENVADTACSPVKKVDVKDWVDGGEITGTEGGDVFLVL
jgi:hypothetical protein